MPHPNRLLISLVFAASTSSIALSHAAAQTDFVEGILPPGSGYRSDSEGRLRNCVPPEGVSVDRTFKAQCRAALKANALARRVTPIDPEAWLNGAYIDRGIKGRRPIGRMRFRLEVDGNGKVASCTILNPSGDDQLDRSVCARLVNVARFVPARNAAGQPITAEFISWIN
ncbi:TonB family protein [Sphingomonas turrisvirgatae]|uniref:TonB family protein n=1 Tax=Sphingomonas turrisvirgatae TaxID=1888892 RepID=UPI001041D61B|nr:TonB family protein [Sphingomonas turrisvirgatae]